MEVVKLGTKVGVVEILLVIWSTADHITEYLTPLYVLPHPIIQSTSHNYTEYLTP